MSEEQNMEKYYLFAGHRYYPEGGMDDFRGEFESIEDAKRWYEDNEQLISGDSYIDNWGHVVDSKLRVVKRFN